MTATNHVITGALIAVTISNPLVALPVAFLAHFALDVLPHYGDTHNQANAFGRIKWTLPLDALIALALLTVIVAVHPAHWAWIALGGIACASPDLWQIPRFVRYLRTKNVAPLDDWFSQFHSRIQWCERLWGVWVEALWFLAVGYVLATKI